MKRIITTLVFSTVLAVWADDGPLITPAYNGTGPEATPAFRGTDFTGTKDKDNFGRAARPGPIPRAVTHQGTIAATASSGATAITSSSAGAAGTTTAVTSRGAGIAVGQQGAGILTGDQEREPVAAQPAADGGVNPQTDEILPGTAGTTITPGRTNNSGADTPGKDTPTTDATDRKGPNSGGTEP
jgi:hypothetical protein